MDNPRELALKSLVKMDSQGSFSNLEINTVISRAELDKSDVSLFTILYMGVIENRLYLDYIISQYSNIPIEKIDTEALNVLRLGIFQLTKLDRIPDYSAVDESVKLSNKRSKGFVNAILRSFLRNNKSVNLPKDKWERISIEHSIPMDIIGIYRSSYGDETADAICTYSKKSSASLSLRVNTLVKNGDEICQLLHEKGIEAHLSEIASDIVICTAPISEVKELIDNGYVFIQDESSRIASMVVDGKKGHRVADVCACPGGKTFSISIDMENCGVVKASDLHKSKLSLITKGAKRLGINIIDTREQNAKEYLEEYDSYFDKVLCDVPCSGLGVMFKKPDIKYKPIEGIKGLPRVQYDILQNCSRYVKVGGELIYSTCTLNKEENEENVRKFLLENECFVPLDFEIGSIKSQGGVYTFLPHITETDGFFIAKMKRIK